MGCKGFLDIYFLILFILFYFIVSFMHSVSKVQLEVLIWLIWVSNAAKSFSLIHLIPPFLSVELWLILSSIPFKYFWVRKLMCSPFKNIYLILTIAAVQTRFSVELQKGSLMVLRSHSNIFFNYCLIIAHHIAWTRAKSLVLNLPKENLSPLSSMMSPRDEGTALH